MKKQASNTFKEGLVMDLAPFATPDTVLTNSLNGTLVTYNGNELMLQNDMGNSCINRVRLDEGYIPTGIAEHGGIIYVASYNPKTLMGLIGSFPYPKVNYYPNDFNNNCGDTEVDYAFDLYNNKNNTIIQYSISNGESPNFKLPMFFTNIIDIPLLYGENCELMDIHSGDSFQNKLPENFKNFIKCQGVKASYIVMLGGSKTYIDSELEEIDRENKIINGNTIYYAGKQSGKLYLELLLDTIDTFAVSLDIIEENNKLKVTFISDTPMFANLNGTNSNAIENSNIISTLKDSFSTVFDTNKNSVNISLYPITKDYGIDGTNERNISFRPKDLFNLKELLSLYKYKWEEGKLTLKWSYLSILQSDLSSSENNYTFNHYFYDINTVNKALSENSIHSSDFSDLLDLIAYGPSVKIIGKKIYKSVSNSFQETFDLPKGIFLHIITTKKVNSTEKVRVLRFVYGTSFMNQFFDNEDITDYNYLGWYNDPEGKWIENIDLDIEDQLFKMDVKVNKSLYTEKGSNEWKEGTTLDPVVMKDVDSGNSELTIEPEEFYNNVSITFSPNADSENIINVSLNSSVYEEHIFDSSKLLIKKNDIQIKDVHDNQLYSDTNYSKLSSLINTNNIIKDYNTLTVYRGIYSNSTGGKLLLEKKITALYPLYQHNFDNTISIGFEDAEYFINTPCVSKRNSATFYSIPIEHIDTSKGHTETPRNNPYKTTLEDEDGTISILELDGTDTTSGVTTREAIMNSIVNNHELGRFNTYCCFNMLNGYRGLLASMRLKYYLYLDDIFSTFDAYESARELDDEDHWSLLTVRDSNNRVRVLPYGGFPGDPYYYHYDKDSGEKEDTLIYASYGKGGGNQLVKLEQATKTYLKRNGNNDEPAIFWIPANLKLYNFLSLIFTLRSVTGTYYIIGADGINTVYSIPDNSYFVYKLEKQTLNSKIKNILYNIAVKTSNLNLRDSLKLTSSCIPTINIKENSSVFYYGNLINLNSSKFKYLVDRYNNSYDHTFDVLVDDISDEDIYIFDWNKLKDKNLLGIIYSEDGTYVGLLQNLVIGFNPRDCSYVYNMLNVRNYLSNSKDVTKLIDDKKTNFLKDWNGYNFFISNLNDYFMTVNKAKRKRPGLITLLDNGILLNGDVQNSPVILEWVEDKDKDAFPFANICFYNHDLREKPVSNYNQDSKKSNDSDTGLFKVIITPEVLQQLYYTIQQSMLNYAKTL